jgi:hypothetical protein
MLHEVCLHRATGRRGAIVPAGAVAWTARERAEFLILALDLSDDDLAALRDGRERVTPEGALVDVPPEEWPEVTHG